MLNALAKPLTKVVLPAPSPPSKDIIALSFSEEPILKPISLVTSGLVLFQQIRTANLFSFK
jgi:hypothetical protein